MLSPISREEFVAVLPHSRMDAAVVCAERIRMSIAALQFDGDRTRLHIAASFGVTERIGQDQDYSALLNRADHALYDAKPGGCNQVASR